MPRFLSCFESPPSSPSTSTSTSNQDPSPILISPKTPPEQIQGCTFCDVSVQKGFKVTYEDDQLIAFHDRTPRAKVHLLVIPRKHVVDSVKDLTSDHLPLLRSMTSLAERLVPPDPPPKMGFHIPPFSSVPHLHLHVFSGSHTFIGRFKYPISTHGDEKGLGWFVTANQVERTLAAGARVGLGRG
ncbi:hypothetical protein IAR55_000800 [Kwoniella newhampshirensis]|uniref:HIT domain-containing protein n=1 Tax=Kwoniella newhampshirensis TaxID=1651941 RepID=A0AAW0Z410_9TREE